MRTLEINGKIIPLKIGLKGSMLLNGKPNLNVEEDTNFILYCALLSNEPPITLKDLQELNIPASERIMLANELLNYKRPTNEKIEDLFQSAVGEIGLNPSEVWSMTKEEIDSAYIGYIYRQQLSANLILASLRKTKINSWSEIKLLPDKGYVIGTDKERQRVFSKLGI